MCIKDNRKVNMHKMKKEKINYAEKKINAT